MCVKRESARARERDREKFYFYIFGTFEDFSTRLTGYDSPPAGPSLQRDEKNRSPTPSSPAPCKSVCVYVYVYVYMHVHAGIIMCAWICNTC